MADLRLSATRATDAVVVLIHGGYWQAGHDRTLEDAVAADLVADGRPVWNLDYRAVGDGGGWPATFLDVAAGMDLLATAASEHGLDAGSVAVVGHSAGGTLALWAAARHLLPTGAPGAAPPSGPSPPSPRPASTTWRPRRGRAWAAEPSSRCWERVRTTIPRGFYELASPAELVPIGVPTLVVTGEDDGVVPPSQSTGYADLADAAGDDVSLEVVAGEDHFAHLDPSSRAWALTRTWPAGHLP